MILAEFCLLFFPSIRLTRRVNRKFIEQKIGFFLKIIFGLILFEKKKASTHKG